MANRDQIFYNFLEDLPIDDKQMMLRAMSDQEIMENCSSEEEYRMIMGEEMPMDFAAYRPDKAADAEMIGEPGATVEALTERLKGIKSDFKSKPSMDRLKEMSKYGPKLPEPAVEITINIGQLRDKSQNLSKS